MRFTSSVPLLIACLVVLGLPACKLLDDIKDVLNKNGIDPDKELLQCFYAQAEVPRREVESGAVVEMEIQPLGGVPPYTAAGVIVQIQAGETAIIERSFTNDTNENKDIVDSATVTDSAGASAICNRTITVLPADGSGGTAALALTASPSNSVVVGNTITITPQPTNLGASPTYEYTFNETGIHFVQAASGQGIFSSDDSQPHDFEVTVKATQGDDSVVKKIQIAFTAAASGALNCSVAAASGSHAVNDEFSVSVTATGLESDEKLVILEAFPGLNGFITSQTEGTFNVFYTTSGQKQIRVKAGTTKGRSCNSGNFMNLATTISGSSSSSLTCQSVVQRAILPSYGNRHVFYRSIPGYRRDIGRVIATVQGAEGTASVAGLTATNSAHGYSYQVAGNALARDVEFTHFSTYVYQPTTSVILAVRDSAGRVATCTPSNEIWIIW